MRRFWDFLAVVVIGLFAVTMLIGKVTAMVAPYIPHVLAGMFVCVAMVAWNKSREW